MKTQPLIVALASLAAVAACEPAKPGQPTFAKDVQPIFEAHCVRCHGAGGTLNMDPTSSLPMTRATGGYFTTYDDVGDCSVNAAGTALNSPCSLNQPITDTSCCHRGAHYYTKDAGTINGASLMNAYLNPPAGGIPMPLPPSPRLSSWEHDVVFTWLANPIR
jgi:hypothetical protein